MRYLVVDGIGRRVEVEATNPHRAREQAKRELKGEYIGELAVYEKLDPVKENAEATREFFAPPAYII